MKTSNAKVARTIATTRKANNARIIGNVATTRKVNSSRITGNVATTRKASNTRIIGSVVTTRKVSNTRIINSVVTTRKVSNTHIIGNGNVGIAKDTRKSGNTERNVMTPYLITAIISIILLTLLSGFCDAQGFLHASNIWDGNKFVWLEGIKSAVGFALGIGMYWICIKFLKEFKIVSPEIQTVGWFSITILGVAVFNRTFFQWQPIDQIVSILVLLGIVWLLVRTAA